MADCRLLAKMALGQLVAPSAAFDGLQGTGMSASRKLVEFHAALTFRTKDKAMVDSVIRALSFADDPAVRARPKVIGEVKERLKKEKIVLGPKRRLFLQKYLKVVWKIDAAVDENVEPEMKWRDVLNDLNALFFLRDGQLGNVMQKIIQDHVDRLPEGETKKTAEAYVLERYVNPGAAKSEKMLRRFGVPIEPSTVVNHKSSCPLTWVSWGAIKPLHDLATWCAVAEQLRKIEKTFVEEVVRAERRREKDATINEIRQRIDLQKRNITNIRNSDWGSVRVGMFVLPRAEAIADCQERITDLERMIVAEMAAE